MKKVPQAGKDSFYEDLDMFFSTGLLTELYKSDDLCICDLGHFTYIVFLYVVDPRVNKQLGFLTSLEAVKRTIERGDKEFFRMIKHCSRKFIVDRTIIFNEKAYEGAMRQVEKMEKTGILPVNVDMEFNKRMRQDFLAKRAQEGQGGKAY